MIQYSLGYRNDFRGTGLLGFIEWHRQIPANAAIDNNQKSVSDDQNQAATNSSVKNSSSSKKDCET
jgi:hypothetical protein